MRVNEENQTVDIEPREINFLMTGLVRQYLFYTKNTMPKAIVFPMYPTAQTADGEIPIIWIPPEDPVAVDIVEDGKVVPEATEEDIKRLDEMEKPPVMERVAEMEEIAEEVVDNTVEILQTQVGMLTQEIEDLKSLLKTLPDVPQSKSEGSEASTGTETLPGTESPAKQALKKVKGSTAIAGVSEDQPPADRIPRQPDRLAEPGAQLSDMGSRDKRDQARIAKALLDEPGTDEDKELEVSDEEFERMKKPEGPQS